MIIKSNVPKIFNKVFFYSWVNFNFSFSSLFFPIGVNDLLNNKYFIAYGISITYYSVNKLS